MPAFTGNSSQARHCANKSTLALGDIALYDPDNIASEFTNAKAIAQLKTPMLDIYGELDDIKAIHAAKTRKIATTKTGKNDLRQASLVATTIFLAVNNRDY